MSDGDKKRQVPTECRSEPIYGHHVTNGLGPYAECVHCGKPVSEWWEPARGVSERPPGEAE